VAIFFGGFPNTVYTLTYGRTDKWTQRFYKHFTGTRTCLNFDAVGTAEYTGEKSVSVNQSRYRPGVAQRDPGS